MNGENRGHVYRSDQNQVHVRRSSFGISLRETNGDILSYEEAAGVVVKVPPMLSLLC